MKRALSVDSQVVSSKGTKLLALIWVVTMLRKMNEELEPNRLCVTNKTDDELTSNKAT